MGIDGVAPGRGQLGGGEELGELGARPGELTAAVVEDLGNGAPAGPAGQDGLLFGGRGAGVVLEGAQDREGGDVGADAAYRAGRGQVVLALRAELGQPGEWLSSSAPGSGSSRTSSVRMISSA